MSTQDYRGSENSETAEAFEVAPVSLLVPQGRYASPKAAGPRNLMLACGDRWPLPTDFDGMVASVDIRDGGLHVSLGLRLTGFDETAWTAFAGLPSVVALLATPPIVWFIVETSGLHSRAPFAIDADPKQAAEIRRLVSDEGAPRSLTLFGIGGYTVRTIHVGVTCHRLWAMFAQAIDEVRHQPTKAEYLEILERAGRVPTGVMFAEAMKRHLTPRLPSPPRRSTAGTAPRPNSW